jgi:hypothetical protein
MGRFNSSWCASNLILMVGMVLMVCFGGGHTAMGEKESMDSIKLTSNRYELILFL